MMASVLTLSWMAIVLLALLEFPSATAQLVPTKYSSLCAELVLPTGYPCDEITVETSDGFLLGVPNIPHGIAGPKSVRGPPVLLMHGLLVAGDYFVLNGPQKSLAFVLADAGFDVYIGNNRNVQWSRGSSKYSPQQNEYWDWTLDELSAIDMPAMVDYIYNSRGTKVFYLGHSQGPLLILAGLTGGGPAALQMKDKLRAVIFMAPVVYVDNLSAPFIKLAFEIYVDKIFPLLGIGQADYRLIVEIVCGVDSDVCTDILGPGLYGENNYLQQGPNPKYLKYFAQPTSSYNLNQQGEQKRTGQLKKYDRGERENLKRYGQSQPPLYDLSKFPSASFPQLFILGGLDQLSTAKDVARLLRELPDAGNRQVWTLPDYGHLDLVDGLRSDVDLYPGIISFFQKN